MTLTFKVDLPGDMSRPADGAVSGAFLRGVRDGLDTPQELSSGMSYEDKALCRAYDEGANLGQMLGRLYGQVPAGE